jgi:hypothetical protein
VIESIPETAATDFRSSAFVEAAIVIRSKIGRSDFTMVFRQASAGSSSAQANLLRGRRGLAAERADIVLGEERCALDEPAELLFAHARMGAFAGKEILHRLVLHFQAL